MKKKETEEPSQQQQSISRSVVVHASNNNPEYYPTIWSPRPSFNTANWLVLSRDERILAIQNVVIRSLRRRLWKAFQEDDKEMAFRAYQVTWLQFLQWLQQEEDDRLDTRNTEQVVKRQPTSGEKPTKVSWFFSWILRFLNE
jgi:hypothetical protein